MLLKTRFVCGKKCFFFKENPLNIQTLTTYVGAKDCPPAQFWLMSIPPSLLFSSQFRRRRPKLPTKAWTENGKWEEGKTRTKNNVFHTHKFEKKTLFFNFFYIINYRQVLTIWRKWTFALFQRPLCPSPLSFFTWVPWMDCPMDLVQRRPSVSLLLQCRWEVQKRESSRRNWVISAPLQHFHLGSFSWKVHFPKKGLE